MTGKTSTRCFLTGLLSKNDERNQEPKKKYHYNSRSLQISKKMEAEKWV